MGVSLSTTPWAHADVANSPGRLLPRVSRTARTMRRIGGYRQYSFYISNIIIAYQCISCESLWRYFSRTLRPLLRPPSSFRLEKVTSHYYRSKRLCPVRCGDFTPITTSGVHSRFSVISIETRRPVPGEDDDDEKKKETPQSCIHPAAAAASRPPRSPSAPLPT